MNRLLIRLMLAGGMMIALPWSVCADEASNVLSFANQLLEETDTYRAITEYKRFLYLRPDDPEAGFARHAIGLAYFRDKSWEPAVAAFNDVMDAPEAAAWHKSAQLLIGESWFQKGDFALALDAFEAFSKNHADDESRLDAGMRSAQCLFLLDNAPLALSRSRRQAAEDPGNLRAGDFARVMEESNRIPRKSPRWAGTLSALLPGAGQLYINRPRDAGISFLLNGGLIAMAVLAFHQDEPVAGGLISILELSWYSGNIYSAVNGAHKYNRLQRQRFIERLNIECGIMRGADSLPVPAGSIGVSF